MTKIAHCTAFRFPRNGIILSYGTGLPPNGNTEWASLWKGRLETRRAFRYESPMGRTIFFQQCTQDLERPPS